MLGGGPVAKGYPRSAYSLVDHVEEHDRRRSSRAVNKPDYFKFGESKNDEDGNESEVSELGCIFMFVKHEGSDLYLKAKLLFVLL